VNDPKRGPPPSRPLTSASLKDFLTGPLFAAQLVPARLFRARMVLCSRPGSFVPGPVLRVWAARADIGGRSVYKLVGIRLSFRGGTILPGFVR
jgi:hypothetical protein